jgi:hypothetical protein
MHELPLVDSHLDLAENVTLFGRDLTLSAARIRVIEKRTTRQATVSLPDLERAGVAVVVATVTAGFLAADVGADFDPRAALYHTPEEAEAQALKQIALYENWERQGRVRLLKAVTDLDHHLQLWQSVSSRICRTCCGPRSRAQYQLVEFPEISHATNCMRNDVISFTSSMF